MKNIEIAKLFQVIQENNLFTNTKIIGKIYNKLIDNPNKEDGAKFIPTFGEPKTPDECSDCRRMLPWDDFMYYQARVKSDGTLMRSNALCKKCRDKHNKKRARIFKKQKADIPPRPKSGDICPNCNRAWTGNWHRDHDYKTKKFLNWICGQCNMATQDRRTPNQKLK